MWWGNTLTQKHHLFLSAQFHLHGSRPCHTSWERNRCCCTTVSRVVWQMGSNIATCQGKSFLCIFFFKSLLFPGSFLSTATEGLVLLWMGRTMYRHRTRREEELSVEELQKLEMALCISGFLSRPCSPVCDTMLMIKVKLHCRCSYVRLFFFF